MSRPLTSYVYVTAEEAAAAYELIIAGDVAVLTGDDGHKIHIQLGYDDEDDE